MEWIEPIEEPVFIDEIQEQEPVAAIGVPWDDGRPWAEVYWR